ncbi:hypothetical protein BC628DRAFT_1332301 [Trametes gibbosa]|nr:hypothetical protein BC628DRAFT_1332301 [Trametes gibbosa]
MDAVDLSWCLTCGCHLEMEGDSQAYCSPECQPEQVPAPSALKHYPSSQHTSSYFSDHFEEDACHSEDCACEAPFPSSPAQSWIGRGSAGIMVWAQSVPLGAPSDYEVSRPKLLSSAAGHVKPSLYVTHTQSSPAEPSRPIHTPQQSLPSLSRDSTSIVSASVVSLTTGSSSYSLATPATGSVVGSLAAFDPPRAFGGKPGLLSGLKAQLRTLGTTSHKDKQRSSTVIRRDADSDAASSLVQKTRRATSPVSLYHMPDQFLPSKRKEAGLWTTATKENAHPPPTSKRATTAVEEHPAFHTRGRKPSRLAS